MPNIPNVLRLIAAIEAAPPERFRMNDWYSGALFGIYPDRLPKEVPPCGTSACIAGFAAMISPDIVLGFNDKVDFEATAKTFLDLDNADAVVLFYNFDATRRQALAALRHLATTGEVDWPKGNEWTPDMGDE